MLQFRSGVNKMNGVDLFGVVVMTVTTLLGLSIGLVKIVIPAIGLLIGIIVAGIYYDAFAHRIFSSHSTTAYIVAFVLVVLLFLIIFIILAYFLRKMPSKILLGWTDRRDLLRLLGWAYRLLGGLLCLIVGTLFVEAIILLLLQCNVWDGPTDIGPSIFRSGVASFLFRKFPHVLCYLLPGDLESAKHFFHEH